MKANKKRKWPRNISVTYQPFTEGNILIEVWEDNCSIAMFPAPVSMWDKEKLRDFLQHLINDDMI